MQDSVNKTKKSIEIYLIDSEYELSFCASKMTLTFTYNIAIKDMNVMSLILGFINKNLNIKIGQPLHVQGL